MFKFPTSINSIQDVIDYCRECIDLTPWKMEPKRAEQVAAGVVHLMAFDVVDELRSKFPALSEILEIASDLEWSNVENPEQSWQQIKHLVAQLEKEIANHK